MNQRVTPFHRYAIVAAGLMVFLSVKPHTLRPSLLEPVELD